LLLGDASRAAPGWSGSPDLQAVFEQLAQLFSAAPQQAGYGRLGSVHRVGDVGQETALQMKQLVY